MTGEYPGGTVPDRLMDCPPSTKLVYYSLAHIEKATPRQIREDTTLPMRTIRRRLAELEERGEVRAETHMGDARKNWYERVRDS